MNSVRIIKYGGRPAIEAGPSALWRQVLDAAYAEKLTPPVTVPTFLSVGGTISTGGFGGTSAREGFQVDHVLELQVVTGMGSSSPVPTNATVISSTLHLPGWVNAALS